MKIKKTCFVSFFFSSALAIGQSRLNVIIVMADDMGWSDIGCYGSEIEPLISTVLQRKDCGSRSSTTPDAAVRPVPAC